MSEAMKTSAIVLAIVIVIVVLVSSGVIGGAFCIKGVGCLYSSGSGVAIDNRESVTISTSGP